MHPHLQNQDTRLHGLCYPERADNPCQPFGRQITNHLAGITRPRYDGAAVTVEPSSVPNAARRGGDAHPQLGRCILEFLWTWALTETTLHGTKFIASCLRGHARAAHRSSSPLARAPRERAVWFRSSTAPSGARHFIRQASPW